MKFAAKSRLVVAAGLGALAVAQAPVAQGPVIDVSLEVVACGREVPRIPEAYTEGLLATACTAFSVADRRVVWKLDDAIQSSRAELPSAVRERAADPALRIPEGGGSPRCRVRLRVEPRVRWLDVVETLDTAQEASRYWCLMPWEDRESLSFSGLVLIEPVRDQGALVVPKAKYTEVDDPVPEHRVELVIDQTGHLRCGKSVVDLRDKKAPGQLTELATQLANAAAARGTREINGVLHVDEPVLVVADMWTEFADVDLVMRAMVAAKPAFRQFHYGATDFDLEERLRRGVRFDPPKAK